MTDSRASESPDPGKTRGPSTESPSTAGDGANPSEVLRALDDVRAQAFDDKLESAPSSGSSEGFSKGFEMLEEIGRGAFGVVHRARDRGLNREVAIKLSLGAFRTLSSSARRRIATEARALAAVDHPNVVRVYSAELVDGQLQIVMELLRGVTLEKWIKLNGLASAEEAAQIGLQLCAALAAIHAKDLIHRDVKPGNVMRVEGGRIVLLDLGLAIEGALQQAGNGEAPAGTPLVGAPEQFGDGARLDARADIYALGVTLYWLVSARYPVEGRSLAEIAQAIRQGRSVPLRDRRPSIPAQFAAVIDRATALAPQERFASAGEFERALQRWLGVHAPEPRAAEAQGPDGSQRARSCTSCGAARVGDESYCKSCGSMLVYPCPRCSSAVDLDARFCSRCGLDVTQWRAAEEQLRAVQAALRRGEFAAARSALAVARDLQPAHPELPRAADELERRETTFDAASAQARAAESERRFAAARDAWSQALECAPDNKSAREARERAHDLARSAALGVAVASVQRAFDQSNWSQARAALAEIEKLALERDAPLVERARQQVQALERRLERARAGARSAYARRELAALELAAAGLRECGEEASQLAQRERELATLRVQGEVLALLDDDLAPEALRAMRELRKQATDWPRSELAALEKRVLAARAAQLARAPSELADTLSSGGIVAGEEFLERVAVLRPTQALREQLEALLARAVVRQGRWRLARNLVALIALIGLGAGTVWTLKLLGASTATPIEAKETAPASTPTDLVKPATSANVQLESVDSAGPSPSVTTEPTRGATGPVNGDPESGTALPPEGPGPTHPDPGPIVSTCAWPSTLEAAARRSRAWLGTSLRETSKALAVVAASVVPKPPPVAPPVRPEVGSPEWLAELETVLRMSGARVSRGEGPLRASVLWDELERAFLAEVERWSAPGESLREARELLALFDPLLTVYGEFLGHHTLKRDHRKLVVDRLDAWPTREVFEVSADGPTADQVARRMLDCARFAPPVKAWLESVVALDPAMFAPPVGERTAMFQVVWSGWAVVTAGDGSRQQLPARMRHTQSGLNFVAVPQGSASFYICETKLGREAMPHDPSKSKLLKPAQELVGLSPHEVRQWAQKSRFSLDVPTTREWQLAYKSAPLFSMLRLSIENGLDELCQGHQIGEYELYVCSPGNSPAPAEFDSALYALRPVRRNVLRDRSEEAR